jgi:hypothetical protein
VALLNLGRRAEAVDAWEDLLERFPDDARLARLRERIGEIRAAAAGTASETPSAR